MDSGNKGVSVIVCCYNSAARLPQTLKHLAKQDVPADISWEIIIVNNASTDNTVEVARKELTSYNLSSVHYVIVDEPAPGLNKAREKGIATAQYEYLVFCDDDNWLEGNYVREAFDTMEKYPTAGAVGGIGDPCCEIAPPAWLKDNFLAYALGTQGEKGDTQIEDISSAKMYVYGAGSVYRKQCLTTLKQNDFKTIVSGRIGSKLVSGDDNELCYALILSKHSILYNPELKFKHFIPKSRLTWEYVLKINEGYGSSSALLLPYKYSLLKKNVPWYKLSWLWLLLGTAILFLKHDLPALISGRYKNDMNAQASLAIRKGVFKSIWTNRTKLAANAAYVKSLAQKF